MSQSLLSARQQTFEGSILRHLEDYYSALEVDNVRARLDEGDPIDDRDLFGSTTLMQAAAAGCSDTVQLLVDRGAGLHYQDNRGNTALLNAQSASTMKILLDAGALVDAQNDDGQTILHISALERDGERVQLLLERGADATLLDRMGHTAEELAGGAAQEILIAHRVNRDREALRHVVGLDANQDEPVQRRRKM